MRKGEVRRTRTPWTRRRFVQAAGAAGGALALSGLRPRRAGAAAVKEVLIGAAYPLTGPQAQNGLELKYAMEVAQEVVNGSFDLPIPLAKTRGLPNLGGAPLRMVIGDSQGSPEKALGEAERLVTQEKVMALFGGHASSVSAVVSQVAERMGVPYVVGESSSVTLHKRGFKWFHRTAPHDWTYNEAIFQFLLDLRKRGHKVQKVAITHEDTLWGTDNGKVQRELAQKYGFEVASFMAYRARSATLTTEIQRVKAADPDAWLPSSYVADAILFAKTARELDFNPRIVVAGDAGHVQNAFIEAAGRDCEGYCSRSAWALDLVAKKPFIKVVNDLYRKRAGFDMSEEAARVFTGVITFADAFNRAGSVAPEAVLKALKATDIPGEQTIMPWRRIKFDPATGQNELADAIIIQLHGGKYYTVWPFELAAKEVIFPIPKWSEKRRG